MLITEYSDGTIWFGEEGKYHGKIGEESIYIHQVVEAKLQRNEHCAVWKPGKKSYEMTRLPLSWIVTF